MEIIYHGSKYFFRECDTKESTPEDVLRLAKEKGYMKYEPNGFVWLVIPGIGYGKQDNYPTEGM